MHRSSAPKAWVECLKKKFKSLNSKIKIFHISFVEDMDEEMQSYYLFYVKIKGKKKTKKAVILITPELVGVEYKKNAIHTNIVPVYAKYQFAFDPDNIKEFMGMSYGILRALELSGFEGVSYPYEQYCDIVTRSLTS